MTLSTILLIGCPIAVIGIALLASRVPLGSKGTRVQRQPTPTVSQADLARVLARDFGGESRPIAEQLLSAYQDREAVRVQLAAIKLSRGDLGSLESFVRVASGDYREVLAPAEYPQYGALPPNAGYSERSRAIDADWKQYQEWLQRS